MTQINQKPKLLYLEAMRILAIFFVIFNHTGNNGYFLFSQRPVGSIQFWFYLVLSVFCKFSVALFFAISGALILGKDESISVLWKKRILKMIVILIIISLIYYLDTIIEHSLKFDLKYFIVQLYSSILKEHLWYIYAYIAYLISLPFLRAIVKSLEVKYYYYMMVIVIFFNSLLPSIEYLLFNGAYKLSNNFSGKISWIATSIIFYPCIGYFLQNKLDFEKINKKIILLLWIVNAGGILLSCYLTYKMYLNTGTYPQTFHNTFVPLNCITIFITVKYLFTRITLPKFAERIFLSLGKCTFGIYLIHLLILRKPFMTNILDKLLSFGLNNMIAILIVCLLTTLICYLITAILLKIPILKKLVGG